MKRRKHIVYLVDNQNKKDNINILREDETKLILHLITLLITNVKKYQILIKAKLYTFTNVRNIIIYHNKYNIFLDNNKKCNIIDIYFIYI